MKKWQKDLTQNIERLYLQIYNIDVTVTIETDIASYKVQYRLTDKSTNKTGILTLPPLNIKNITHDRDYTEKLDGGVERTVRGRDFHIIDAMPSPYVFV